MVKIRSNLYSTPSTMGENIKAGIGLGAFAGGIVGATLGGIQADKKIKSLPVETVEVKVREPVYETKEIGKIPKNQYVPRWPWGSVNTTPTESVYEKVPVKDENGKVVYKEYTQIFQGHGKPVVNYKTYEVKDPVFKGYTQTVWEDTDEYCRTVKEYDPDTGGYEEIKKCYEKVEGYWVYFRPKVEYKVIDTYQKPEVIFETGVNMFEHIILGGLIGAAVGGIVGGVVGATLSKISELKENK